MYLTNAEHEAFTRAQAAGLIPPDLPIPANDQEIAELIYHVGILVDTKIGYRDATGKLRVTELTTFTSEHLDKLAANAPFRRTTYPNWLKGLSNYFTYGPQIVTPEDLAGRLALNQITPAQILRGFDLKYVPPVRPDQETPKPQLLTSVTRLLNAFNDLNPEEKTILNNLINKKVG